MPSPAFHLIPAPHSIKRRPGSLRLESICEIVVTGRAIESTRVAAGQLALAIVGATGGAPAIVERQGRGTRAVVLGVRARGPRGAHTIRVDAFA